MEGLLDSAEKFDGVLLGTVVPTEKYELVAVKAWAHRWNPTALDRDIADVAAATAELEASLADAAVELSTNTTASSYETTIDLLSGGFVASVIDDADSFCEAGDIIACVSGDDPQLVHFDAADNALPYMTDVLKTGVAYHEFAHVLQFTNPEPTEVALEAFGGDVETMADCFALTYLDGWKLDHRIFVGRYEYWDVSIGYGYTCDETQRQAIRDWYALLGYTPAPISQER